MKITKSQLQKIIKEEVQKVLTEEKTYQLFYKDKGGESGIKDVYADSEKDALEKARVYVIELGEKHNQEFRIEKLMSPEGDRIV